MFISHFQHISQSVNIELLSQLCFPIIDLDLLEPHIIR